MRTAVHPAMIQAVSAALLNNGNLMAPISTSVSNDVERESNRVKKEENFSGLARKIHELPPSPPNLDPIEDDDITFIEKKTGANIVIRRTRRNRAGLQGPFKKTLGM